MFPSLPHTVIFPLCQSCSLLLCWFLPLTVSWCEPADAGLTASHPVALPSPAAMTGGTDLPNRYWEWLISHRHRKRRRINRRQKNTRLSCHFLIIIKHTEQLRMLHKHTLTHISYVLSSCLVLQHISLPCSFYLPFFSLCLPPHRPPPSPFISVSTEALRPH